MMPFFLTAEEYDANLRCMDEAGINGRAWDGEAENGSAWARIASAEEIREAGNGRPGVRVTIDRNVPLSWIEPLRGGHVLLLGGGGGQQTPVLAAYGCSVECVDASHRMLEKDKEALDLYSLNARLHEMDMSDLSVFPDGAFDGIISPVSLNFVPDILRVYREAARVLRKGGIYIFGIANPALYMFDDRLLAKGRMKIKYTIPFSDEKSLSEKELKRRIAKGDTVEFSHTLEAIIGGLTECGFAITGFFSDGTSFEPVDSFLHDCYIAIRAVRIED